MSTLKIPEFRLLPEALTEQAKELKPFQWASPEVGKRHKLGGSPEFLQESRFPKCGKCGKEMTFYGQLDSINDDYCIADVGMVYVFICFDCYETASFIQSG